MINILTRVSRPEYFNVLKASVDCQTYKHYKWVIGTDNFSVSGCDVVNFKEVNNYAPVPLGLYYTPYNNYFSQLFPSCDNGWIMHMDDDDMFIDCNSLQTIADNCVDEDEIVVWKVQIKPDWIVPSKRTFGTTITVCDFSGIGFAYHIKHNPVDWGFWSQGDFRVGKQLEHRGLKIRWVDEVLTRTQKGPHNGKI